jgi:hypothetical protein
MKRETLFIGLLILLIVVMFGFGSKLGMRFQRVLTGPLPQFAGENLTTLRSTVEGYGAVHTLAANLPGAKTIPVYSRYPFNLKNEILIAAGTNDGIKEGDIALFEGSILGSVEKAFSGSALVETIFDSRFKTPVRIGTLATDALLIGGSNPELTLIPANAAVNENDQVYSAGEGWPYGMTLGALHDVKSSENSLYKNGALRVSYNPASLSQVTVVPKGTVGSDKGK